MEEKLKIIRDVLITGNNDEELLSLPFVIEVDTDIPLGNEPKGLDGMVRLVVIDEGLYTDDECNPDVVCPDHANPAVIGQRLVEYSNHTWGVINDKKG